MKIALNSTAFIIFLFAFFGNNVIGQTIFGTGGLTISNDAYNAIPVASTPGMGNNPSSADLSNWFPIAGNQGTQGSCVAWACCALKAYYEAKEVGSTASSLNLAFSPSFIYNQIKISSCGNGSYLEKALTFLETDGVCELKDFPYNPNNCSNIPGCRRRGAHHHAGPRRLRHLGRGRCGRDESRRMPDLHRCGWRLHHRSARGTRGPASTDGEFRGNAGDGEPGLQGPADPLGRIRRQVQGSHARAVQFHALGYQH